MKSVVNSVVDPVVDPVFNPGSATVDAEYQQLMSDVFHDLSQPLSTLTCLVEVNLLLSRPAKQLRHDLKIALKQVHSIVRLIRALRELVDAGNAHQDQQVLPLAGCLREVVADLLPVAELANVKLSLLCRSGTSSSDCLVNFQASRLRQALFHLLEFALGSAAAGAEVKITAGDEDEAARLTVAISAVTISTIVISEAGGSGPKARAAGGTAESAERKQRELKRRLGLAIARRIFESAAGSLHTEDSGERLWLEVRLPLVSLPK
jgi:K+-sensing histidine kinase KdpD